MGWDTQRTGGEGVGTGMGYLENWERGGRDWGGILRELGERG